MISVTTGVWDRLSDSCHDAFGWAAALDTKSPPLVVTETLLLGIIHAHPDRSEPEVLLRHFGRTAADLEEAVGQRSPRFQNRAETPLSLTDLPTLSTNTRRALEATFELYEKLPTSDRVVPLRYLFGGLLALDSSVAYQVLSTVLQGADIGAIAISYVGDFLANPSEISYADILKERFPGTATPEPPPRERAVFSGQPQLQVSREAELRMIEEALTNPTRPVAILKGPRGAGKTALGILASSRLAARFPDGQVTVSWANDSRRRTDVIAEVESRLSVSASGTGGLAAALSGKRVLLFFNDVPSNADLTGLLPAAPSATMIAGVSPPTRPGDAVVPVGGVTPAAALELLGSAIGSEPALSQGDVAQRLVQAMNYLPGNIVRIANVIRAGDATVALLADWLSKPEQKAADGDVLAERAGKEFAHTEPFRRERAGYASDAETTRDDLDFRSDVMPLCEVIMAQDVTPPLSIGLFGEWGSGKSSFMRLMRQEIDRISRESATAKGSRPIAFCTDVRQIVFNAWHYADANLWASLVIHMFEELGSPTGPDAEAKRRQDFEAQRKLLVIKLETQKQLLKEATARQDAAVTKLTVANEALRAVLEAPIKAALDDPQVKLAQATIVRDLGIDAPPEKVEEMANKLAGLPGQIREGWLLLGRGKNVVPVAVAIGLALIVALVSWAITPALIAWIVTLVFGSLATIAGFVAGPLAVARTVAGAVSKGAERIQQARSKAVEKQAELKLEVQEAEREVADIKTEIKEIEAGHRLRKFLEDRSRSTDYLSHLGIISLIRKDFEELSRLLEDNRLARKDDKDAEVPNKGLPSIERVILYIDDLDRCSATKVVEVLEAVHLLLAFDIFVAVVGVDPRWLLKSLERHYSTQLAASRPAVGGGVNDEWAATPQNYLEKIFQIPFVLKPMGKTGYEALVGHHMLARPETTPGQSTSAADESAAQGPLAQSGQTSGAVGTPPETVTATVEDALPSIDVDPDNLKVYDAELKFAKSLSPLIGTPRAAKRLINTYRLIRASLSEADYGSLVRREPPGDYQTVLTLLAVVIGFPGFADALFDRLLGGSPDEDFWTVIRNLEDVPPRGARDIQSWKGLRKALLGLSPSDGAQLPLKRITPWIPRVARYSFQTWQQGMVIA